VGRLAKPEQSRKLSFCGYCSQPTWDKASSIVAASVLGRPLISPFCVPNYTVSNRKKFTYHCFCGIITVDGKYQNKYENRLHHSEVDFRPWNLEEKSGGK